MIIPFLTTRFANIGASLVLRSHGDTKIIHNIVSKYSFPQTAHSCFLILEKLRKISKAMQIFLKLLLIRRWQKSITERN